MPVSPTYPGVYVEEIPSGVRTITGVATSITAFIGRAKRGPINEPVTIFNFGDFERAFGGLGVDYPMSYAVRDFFLNGGAQAVIVRLFKAPAGDTSEDSGGTDDSGNGGGGAAPGGETDTGSESGESSEADTGYATLTDGELKLRAASPGEWGNNLTFDVDYEGIDYLDKDDKDNTPISDEAKQTLYERYGLNPEDDSLFNITIRDTSRNITERITNVTFKDVARRLDRVLEQDSLLARFQEGEEPDSSADRPADGTTGSFSGGVDSADLDENAYTESKNNKTGIYALEKVDLFNLLCIPPDRREADTLNTVYQTAMKYCVDRRAMLIVDSPSGWGTPKETAASKARKGLDGLGLSTLGARNAALYFPRVVQADPLRDGQLDTFVPCGIVAGIMARTDVRRGVWKAPAGIDDGGISGIQGLAVNLTDEENGLLNPLGINCLRAFPILGRVVWGARTLRGADQLADEYKYVPIRRLALFIEESLYRGLQWVVFEPNDEPLWAQIRLNVGAFMQNLFRQGAFQGSSPREAYFVKCDKETNPQYDIDRGIVNIHVGFAPLKPAEFVIIKLQQIAGQLEV